MQYCPAILGYTTWAYGAPTKLYLADGSQVAASAKGVRQGDPLGMLLFSVVLQKVLLSLKETFPVSQFIAYADDLGIYTTIDQIPAIMEHLTHECRSIGLTINSRKSTVYTKYSNPFEASGLRVTNEGLEVLGCPFGSQDFVSRNLDHLFDDLRHLLRIVVKLGASLALPIIRYCVNTKGGYLARVCPPWMISIHARSFDQIMADLIGNMIGVFDPLPDYSRTIITLPEKMGGIGITPLTLTSQKGWTVSFLNALARMGEGQIAEDLWIDVRNMRDGQFSAHIDHIRRTIPHLSDFEPTNRIQLGEVPPQKALIQPEHERTQNELMTNLEEDTARASWFKGQSTISAPWLNAALFGHHCVALTNEAYVWNLRLRLLMNPTRQLPPAHPCGRGEINLADTSQRYHCFSCGQNGEIIDRHNTIQETLTRFITSHIPGAYIRKNVLLASTGRALRSDFNVTLPGQHEVVIDVRVSNTGAPSYQGDSPDTILGAGEAQKIHKYSASMRDRAFSTHYFVPFIVLTTGNIGTKASDWIDRLAQVSTLQPDVFKTFLARHISISLAFSLHKAALLFQRQVLSPTNTVVGW
jgi:hypothetical protein